MLALALFLPLAWWLTGTYGNHGLWLAFLVFMIVRGVSLGFVHGKHIKVNHLWLEVVAVLQDRQLAESQFQGRDVGGEADHIYLPLETGLARLKRQQLSSELDGLKLRIDAGVEPSELPGSETLDVEELWAAEGVFISNSQFGILPVQRCGEHAWPLQEAFLRLEVNIRCFTLDRIGQYRIDQSHQRLAVFLDIALVVGVVRLAAGQGGKQLR